MSGMKYLSIVRHREPRVLGSRYGSEREWVHEGARKALPMRDGEGHSVIKGRRMKYALSGAGFRPNRVAPQNLFSVPTNH